MLQIYQWDTVKCDWNCGAVWVIAESAEEARRILLEDNGNKFHEQDKQAIQDNSYEVIPLEKGQWRVYSGSS